MLIIELYDEQDFRPRRKCIDFKTTGRWKTIQKGKTCDLYIEVLISRDISKWYQGCNMQDIPEWVREDSFLEVYPTVETINECN